jgi:hypothetical protein
MRFDLPRLALAFAGIALFVVPGLGLTQTIRPLRRLPLAAQAAWAYLLGIAWVAGGAYVASHIFGILLKRGLFLWLAAAPAVAGLVSFLMHRGPMAGPAGRRRRPRDPVAVAALASAVFVCAGLYAEALRNPLTDWDGRMTWFTQARFVREARTVDAAAIRDDRWFLTNRRYPLLMPLAQIAVQETLDLSDDERTVRPLYATFFPVFLLLLWFGASRLAGVRPAALTVLAASVVPFFGFWNHGGAAGGYSDFPLGCFLGAGALLLLLGRSPSARLGAGLLLAAAVLTKREGLPAAFACLAVGAAWAILPCRRDRGRSVAAAARLLPALAVVATAGAFFRHWASGIVRDGWDEGYFTALTNRETWRMFLPRLTSALPRIVRETFELSQWGILWVVLPLIVVIGAGALRRPRIRALMALSLISPGLGLAAYGVHWDPPALAAVTWSRFLAQASLPLFLLLAACLREGLSDHGAGARR